MADHLIHGDLRHEQEPPRPDELEQLASIAARRVMEPDTVRAELMGSRESARELRAKYRQLGSHFTSQGPLPLTPQDDIAAILDGRIVEKS